MAGSNLMLHCGGRDVTPEQLQTIAVPSPTETWFPVAHSRVLQSVSETLSGAGFEIKAARLSLSHGDQRFFGTLDLANKISDASGGISLAVGVRNSTDKSFPIGFCCGQRVFVCDNLAFTSEIVVSKKHTRFGNDRYLEGISKAVTSLSQYQQSAASWIDRLAHWDLAEDAANSYLLQAYEQGIIGTRLLPLVIEEWRNPQFEDYQPRTGWSLWNAFTTVLGRTRQVTQPAATALTTIRLQKLLSPPEIIDVESSETTAE